MLHISTRGEASALPFIDALMTGLAGDGGLYWPESFPTLTPDEIAALAGKTYAAAAEDILSRLASDSFEPAAFRRMIEGAYSTFRHPATCPLVQLEDNLFVLELFHGPTLAFKDVAMQLLGRLMDHVLEQRGQRATIVGATSGDTGSAAVAAFEGSRRADVFILYPHGRVSDVQRRQMTTVDAPNVHALAIEGSFDDCQAIVKALFGRPAFRDEMRLSGVNSINWARVAAQAVYYFTAAVALGSPHRKVAFSVPTGNFGDILAGWVAARMGLPIAGLTIATNANDILVRALESGRYEVTGVVPTSSPSMDIQVSSNFERLLFEAGGRDANAVRTMMASLRQSGAFTIAPQTLARIRQDFGAQAVDEAGVAEEIGRTWREAGYLLDPHTAIATAAARTRLAADPATPVVALSTAHPAKFPDAVEKASGIRPGLPPHMADLFERKERFTVLPNDADAVAAYLKREARAVHEVAA